MLEDLLPGGVTDAARRLGVSPIEVVRLMVVSDTVTSGFSTTEDHLRKLAEVGGIESGWWDGAELPSDSSPHRQRVRAAIGLLLGRTAGNQSIRMDNLWRGLPVEDQQWVAEAMDALAFDGKITVANARSGVMVSVTETQRAILGQIAAGKAESEALNELYQG